MTFKRYIKDKLFHILIIFFSYFIILMFLLIFKSSNILITFITFIFFIMNIIILFYDYFRKQKFYKLFNNNLTMLDKKYLVLETLEKPNFLEGELLFQYLYEIDKSMIENVNKQHENIEDFKDYVEMWIHEVKIPISSLTLLCHNHKDVFNKSYYSQVRKLDNYIDQVLYYVRSNYTEQNFIIKEVNLLKVISNIALKNKDDLLENKIELIVEVDDLKVFSDQKWLEFVINQIVNNSIKYRRDEVDSYIKIYTSTKENLVSLHILDNGIGILEKDIASVFKKSFTGENGSKRIKSTGMGLYIADKLCRKLGHRISISSVFSKETEVIIDFYNNDFYKFN